VSNTTNFILHAHSSAFKSPRTESNDAINEINTSQGECSGSAQKKKGRKFLGVLLTLNKRK
jgi:hypothetical protein